MPAMGQGKLKQEDDEFKACFGHLVSSYLKIKNNKMIEAGSQTEVLA